jgi:hypothetical protein
MIRKSGSQFSGKTVLEQRDGIMIRSLQTGSSWRATGPWLACAIEVKPVRSRQNGCNPRQAG